MFYKNGRLCCSALSFLISPFLVLYLLSHFSAHSYFEKNIVNKLALDYNSNMWIVILNFCLFILLICFMLYGFGKWTKLITEYNDGSEEFQKDSNIRENPKNVIDGKYYRLPMWILFFGLLINHVVRFIQYLLVY